MNTHIIIPIKDIEKAKNTYSADTKVANLYKLIQNAKQISLDEKDIEEKADNYTHKYDLGWLATTKREKMDAYKQALKDLL